MNKQPLTLLDSSSTSVTISEHARNLARKLAQRPSTPEESLRVVKNTLSLCAVKDFLEDLGYRTDLSARLSNPNISGDLDFSELRIINKGPIACIPLEPGEIFFEPPQEKSANLVAYLAVRIDPEVPEEAIIYGFLPKFHKGQICISDLEPVWELPDHFAGFQEKVVVDLEQWFKNVLAFGWAELDRWVAGRTIPVRSEIPSTLKPHSLVLGQGYGLSLLPKKPVPSADNGDYVLPISILPDKNSNELPPGLCITLRDENGEFVEKTELEQPESAREIEFTVKPEEVFTLDFQLMELPVQSVEFVVPGRDLLEMES